METKCFESRERFGSHLGPFPGILKQLEEIEKSWIFKFFRSKVKQFIKDLGIFESKKKIENFFFKNNKINRKSAAQTF